jgi:hypothetical protein
MAFKALNDLSSDVAIQLGGTDRKTNKPNQSTITGYFLGTRQVDSPKSKTGKSALHIFQTSTGNVGVWGKTNLDQKLQSATPGALTRVTFTGMQPTKNNPMYVYNVEIDLEDTIAFHPPGAKDSKAARYPDEDESPLDRAVAYEEYQEEEEDLDMAPPPVATAPRVAAKAADPAAIARMNALVSSRRK